MTRRQSTIVVLLLVVLGAGAALTWMRVRETMRREALLSREAALKDALLQMRKAIDRFHTDQQRYPYSLQELVPQYMPRIPIDPITENANWRVTTEETVQPSDDFTTRGAQQPRSVVIDVHSTAGKPYSDY